MALCTMPQSRREVAVRLDGHQKQQPSNKHFKQIASVQDLSGLEDEHSLELHHAVGNALAHHAAEDASQAVLCKLDQPASSTADGCVGLDAGH